MAAFLADEHVWQQLTAKLRLLGHDVSTVREHSAHKSGSGISDEEVLKLALREKRIIITHNRHDFEALHKAMPWHSGIAILGQAGFDWKLAAKALDEFAKAHANHTNQILILTQYE